MSIQPSQNLNFILSSPSLNIESLVSAFRILPSRLTAKGTYPSFGLSLQAKSWMLNRASQVPQGIFYPRRKVPVLDEKIHNRYCWLMLYTYTLMLSVCVCVCVSTERNKNQPFSPYNNLIYASQTKYLYLYSIKLKQTCQVYYITFTIYTWSQQCKVILVCGLLSYPWGMSGVRDAQQCSLPHRLTAFPEYGERDGCEPGHGLLVNFCGRRGRGE